MTSTTSKKRKNAIPLTVWVAIAGTILLAAGAFTLSFAALTDLAKMSGITPELAWIWAPVVDGVIVVASCAIIALAGRPRRVLAYPWVLLTGGAIISIAANSLHAILAADGVVPAAVAAGVAAVPPVALLAMTHMTVLLIAQQNIKPASKRTRGIRENVVHLNTAA